MSKKVQKRTFEEESDGNISGDEMMDAIDGSTANDDEDDDELFERETFDPYLRD
ncbi:hypothetical protein JCGZ_07885 [Jatropha curcas]|uniref:Uncharacterized protein n=1 Tax=Jatropha curcas TaxID=180498 RepID=A0A067KKL6_JATCU|nr:hypothetical protein JCGZ_07885 [Jatropha curcas]